MNSSLEMLIEGCWLSPTGGPPGLENVEKMFAARPETRRVMEFADVYWVEVEHPEHGHMTVRPISFPMRLKA